MGIFKKKADPILKREHALDQEIAALEAQIKDLDSRIAKEQYQPRTRSTAFPSGHENSVSQQLPEKSILPSDPIFESVDQRPVTPLSKPNGTATIQSELEIETGGFERTWRRLGGFLNSTPTRNPKLVSYLAAGSIKGLRPLRYEKRIARNRFIALSFILVLLLWGIYSAFISQS